MLGPTITCWREIEKCSAKDGLNLLAADVVKSGMVLTQTNVPGRNTKPKKLIAFMAALSLCVASAISVDT